MRLWPKCTSVRSTVCTSWFWKVLQGHYSILHFLFGLRYISGESEEALASTSFLFVEASCCLFTWGWSTEACDCRSVPNVGSTVFSARYCLCKLGGTSTFFSASCRLPCHFCKRSCGQTLVFSFNLAPATIHGAEISQKCGWHSF